MEFRNGASEAAVRIVRLRPPRHTRSLRQVKRSLFKLAAVTSLVLFTMTVALWVRSYFVCARAYTQLAGVYGFASGHGRFSVDWWWLSTGAA